MAIPTTEDQLAVIDVTVAYCWALDTHDWPALDNVFLPDATAELSSPVLHGIEAIKRRIAFALDPLDDSQHIVTNHQVDVDGDRATCRCYLHAQHVLESATGGPNFVIGGRYEDSLVRTPDGWRIEHRRLVTMWREGNPSVVHSLPT